MGICLNTFNSFMHTKDACATKEKGHKGKQNSGGAAGVKQSECATVQMNAAQLLH